MASNQTQTAAAPSEVIEVRIERLFLRLSAIYGYLWWNMYQNAEYLRGTKLEWSTCLKRFSNRVLKEVLLSYREKKGFPPNLPEFVEACNAIQKRIDPCQIVVEPYVPADEAIVQKNIQEIYKYLKHKPLGASNA